MGDHRRRSPCVDPTHRRQRGTRRCVDCAMVRQRARYAQQRAARGEVLLQRPGESAHRAGALAMWERRRAVYGPSGRRPADERVPTSRSTYVRPTHCRRGHPLSGANVAVERYRQTTRRRCLTCRRLRRQGVERPVMVTLPDGVRVSVEAHDAWHIAEARRLRSAMVAAHPDRPTGSTAKFIAARRTWERFVAQEQQWYDAAGVARPSLIKRKDAA